MRHIERIIIHCSATPEGRNHTVEDIRKWHLQAGYNDIGYHFVIYLDGTVKEGRNINLVGAHTSGKNTGSIGICYIGGCDKNMKPKDTRTDAQKKALYELCKTLIEKYNIKYVNGHNEFASKACPSFDVKNWIKETRLK